MDIREYPSRIQAPITARIFSSVADFATRQQPRVYLVGARSMTLVNPSIDYIERLIDTRRIEMQLVCSSRARRESKTVRPDLRTLASARAARRTAGSSDYLARPSLMSFVSPLLDRQSLIKRGMPSLDVERRQIFRDKG